MNGPAVLVIEDVPQIRATAVQLFQELGCEVFDAYNGYDALKILEAHPEIQVVFADVCMPGMKGPELAQVARRLRPDLKIVLTSGYVGKEDVLDDTPFVPKPWRTGDLGALHKGFDGLASGRFPVGSGTCPTKQTVKISVQRN
jgi:CheY-like chemotaxis protein